MLLSPLVLSAQVIGDVEPRDEVVVPPPSMEQGGSQIFEIVEEMPAFPGGQEAMFKYLSGSMVYPPDMVDAGIQGKVFVEFIVRKDGSITDAKVLRGAAGPLDQEALRVVRSMPKWTPGRQQGVAVDCRYRLPIAFHLN